MPEINSMAVMIDWLTQAAITFNGMVAINKMVPQNWASPMKYVKS